MQFNVIAVNPLQLSSDSAVSSSQGFSIPVSAAVSRSLTGLLCAQTQYSRSQPLWLPPSRSSCLHLSDDTRQNSRWACLAVSSKVCAFLFGSLFYNLPVTSCLAPCSCFSRNAFCFRNRKCALGPWQLSPLGFSFCLCNACNLISCSSLLRKCASLPATVDVSQKGASR